MTDSLGFKAEKRDLLRGIAAGLIFGMPLLFTMEIWYAGKSYHPLKTGLILLITIFINIGFSYFAGLRQKNSSAKILEAIDDGLCSILLGFVSAVLILALIGKINFNVFEHAAQLGMVILEACLISIGISFTNFKFKEISDRKTALALADHMPFSDESLQLKKDLNDLAATVAGALIFSFNMAPTEEIVSIAAGLNGWQLLLLLGMELVFCYIILYASGLEKNPIYEKDSFFQKPWVETIMATSIGLIVSMLLVQLIGHKTIYLHDPHFLAVSVTLGLPAVIGGAAGRIII